MSDPLAPFTPPASAPAEVRAGARAAPHPVLAEPVRPRRPLLGWAVAGFIVVGLAVLAVLAYLLIALGAGLLALSSLLALIPLAIVLVGVRWVDRWEPEPRGLMVFGFLWGAGVAVALALIVDVGVQLAVYTAGIDASGADVLGGIVQAPIVEETAKGLGVLLIFLVGRRFFDGPVDGIVYAAVVAGGFAFTENILYFADSVAHSGLISTDAALTVFIRGVLSPFAHVMFTSATGLFIGLWGRRSVAGGIGGFFVGLIPAMLLHAFWNTTALLGLGGWFLVYLVVQVPLFAGLIALVVRLQRQEVRLTGQRLAEYADAGWLSHGEVVALATPAGRRQALAWANAHGAARVMKAYIRDATTLAFTRQRIVTGRDRIGAQRDEQELLGRLTSSRRALQQLG